MHVATMTSHPYATVERAIRYLRARAGEQPTLAELALHVGMSEHHLQRLFSEWAGISPKRFVQSITAARAEAALRANDVLTAAHEVGLSGPGRLHDLMVNVRALTPGELRARGEGVEVMWGIAGSPLGPSLLARTGRGICHFALGDTDPGALMAELDRARFARDDLDAARWVERVFSPVAARAPVPVLLSGTNFQLQVWRAILRVPAGRWVSYGDVARSIGRPGAARAVGGALAKNKLAILIPCHRVLREDGTIGEYRWGEARKRALLATELDPAP